MTRFIFITGGVVSSLGKGLAAACMGALLQLRGYKVRLRKLDPYLNIDPGTMSPFQHGEVFVTEDGAETDLDLGHYERFTGVPSRGLDSVSAGKIYWSVLRKERRGEYLGGTIQVVPHVTSAIKDFIISDLGDEDIVLCEIGGTVGDIEGLPFFEAIRQFAAEMPRDQVAFVHMTLVPWISTAKELKTKPTQHSVRELRSIGIQPDILMCRSEREIPAEARRKIALQCSVHEECVVPALDCDTIYEVPLHYHKAGLDYQLVKALGLPQTKDPDLRMWINIVERIKSPVCSVCVAIVGKYTGLADAYKSLIEALVHGGISNQTEVKIDWVDADELLTEGAESRLKDADAILVPGGFGKRGSEGKISAITHARVTGLPFLGICFGMQMACIEAARSLGGLNGASSSEFGDCEHKIVGLLTEWETEEGSEQRDEGGDLGGTMRLGSYPAILQKDSLARTVYKDKIIHERHRHRYEVNINYREVLEKTGLVFSGLSPNGKLPEIVEYPDHPWFLAVQFHPELKSRPFEPHPIFDSFVNAARSHATGGKIAIEQKDLTDQHATQ